MSNHKIKVADQELTPEMVKGMLLSTSVKNAGLDLIAGSYDKVRLWQLNVLSREIGSMAECGGIA